ncbi:rac GTPase-activating protein 1 [Toxorhynchites rutilus septentrionalis]|uniref:rac GTPase-activating protein 1 n=1 Tax=Toxorhynchites rutilus septentrionalis TaxID=329112 RepID=UPI0024795C9A|nr:rac GTPase-activating protein 1 [Toxorhynchites rutilus septentrionalis]
MAMELSIVAQFDELRRCSDVLRDGTAEIEFLRFVQLQEECRVQWLKAVQEAKRLQRELDAAIRGMSDLETNIFHARKLLEEESKARKHAEHERDAMEKKMFAVCDILKNEQFIKDETRERLAFMNAYSYKRKSTHNRTDEMGNDINSTGSFLSDLSLTQSEDDLLDVKMYRNRSRRDHRPSYNVSGAVHAGHKRTRLSQDASKRKSINESKKIIELGPNEKIVAHTKVSVPQDDGPILAESIIQAMPSQQPQFVESMSQAKTVPKKDPEAKENISPNRFKTPTKTDSKYSKMNMFTPSAPPIEEMNQNYNGSALRTPTMKRSVLKQHSFTGKTFLKSETCTQCQQRIRFGSVGLRCRECKAVVHSDCRDQMKIACIPQSSGTPTNKNQQALGNLADYAPNVGPMIPALIVHCVNEIEMRGLTEVGIYRVPGSEREVRTLKEKFLRGKTVPNLSNMDINVLCGCVKDFLRSLREPLIPLDLWKDFSNAVQAISSRQKQQELFEAIAKMPQPNRDTLAYLIQHFQRIDQCKEVKMPLENLARVFAPTIVGYSSPDLDAHATFAETVIQFNVLESLLNIPTDYWSQFIAIEEPAREDDQKRFATLNTKSYMGTPLLKSGRKERKFYATPPYPTKKK